MRARIVETFEIPAIPYIVNEIMELKTNKPINTPKLINLVAKDPSLSAQVMRWACSPYYKSKDSALSLEDAVSKILGSELVTNICIGLSVGKPISVSNDKIIGLKSFWEHSFYTATLVEALAELVPKEKKVSKSFAYLAGLLHDFGYLILSQIFPPQFKILTQTMQLNRDVCSVKLENHLFQVNHQQIAAWLLESWNLPKELIIAIKYHHHGDYFGKYAIYPNLIFIADNLLKKKFIHNGKRGRHVPTEIFDFVGITSEQAKDSLDIVLKNKNKIDKLAEDIFKNTD